MSSTICVRRTVSCASSSENGACGFPMINVDGLPFAAEVRPQTSDRDCYSGNASNVAGLEPKAPCPEVRRQHEPQTRSAPETERCNSPSDPHGTRESQLGLPQTARWTGQLGARVHSEHHRGYAAPARHRASTRAEPKNNVETVSGAIATDRCGALFHHRSLDTLRTDALSRSVLHRFENTKS